MYDITPIIEAVAALIGVIVTCVLIPFIKSKTTASQQAEINAWVKIAVSAAEQIFKGSGRGEEKKQYVIAWLKERGVTVDENELDALIEAAVYELTQGIIPLEGITIDTTTEVTEDKEETDPMSNSSLVTYTKISPNRTSPRNHKIDTISIHCFVGQVTAKSGCNAGAFTKYDPDNGASCNYVVGHDGSIGLCVEEKDRSWCTSSGSNDHRGRHH